MTDRATRFDREPEVRAFVHLAPAAAEHEAPAVADGTAPLAGLTAGIKDVIETADMPTALGSAHYAGRHTGRDAAVVSALRAAGATVVGKTTTAEFAYRDAPETRNPLDPTRTPGGSSSGSAAAVAAGMVDVALATQTGGSIIRPAAYCGVVGYKPTYGLVPTSGVMQLAPSFDTVGVIARDVATVARGAEVIAGVVPEPDRNRRNTDHGSHNGRGEPHPRGFSHGAAPRVGMLPAADLTGCAPEMLDALRLVGDVVTGAGAELVELTLPIGRLRELHGLINAYEGARSLAAEAPHCREQTAGLIERGLALGLTEYVDAIAEMERLRPGVDQTLSRVDVVLSPASFGPAPVGLHHTGRSDFCQPWSAARVPAITIPVTPAPGALPLGLQITAPRWEDTRLLGWAARLEALLG